MKPELLNQILQALAAGAVLGLGTLAAIALRGALQAARKRALETPAKDDDKLVEAVDKALTDAGLPNPKQE